MYISERIIPAIMAKSFDELREQMNRFISVVPLVQIDVMDGKMTDSKSWPYMNSVDGEFLKIINQEEGFPFWEDLNIEADLMVSDPAKVADQWIAAGAIRIVLHYESASPEVISTVLKSIKEKGIEAGLAVGLETSLDVISAFYTQNKDSIDVVQFMGIEKIGFQGEPFDERVTENIKKFKESFPEAVLSVDGGVHLESGALLADAGANRLIVGSELQNGQDVNETIGEFDNFLNI